MFREAQGHLYSTVLVLRIGLFMFAFFLMIIIICH